mmetsp:Transcript_11536/g.25224  ORF Transcript_11536/g.25224 Transcript_11536/m.25224 type:complete len:452 (-) Transcript_11536:607-1962(-)
MGKKVVGKKARGQESPTKAPAEAQATVDAQAACTRHKCCRPATRLFQCQMCPVGCRPEYPACDKCNLEDGLKSDAKKLNQKKLKLKDLSSWCGTCMQDHLQTKLWHVLTRSPSLKDMSASPARAAGRAPRARAEDGVRDEAAEPRRGLRPLEPSQPQPADAPTAPPSPGSEEAAPEEESDGRASTRAVSSAIDREASTGGDTSDSEEDAGVGAAGEPAGLSRDLDGMPEARETAASLEEERRATEEADVDEYFLSRVREVDGEDTGAEALRPRSPSASAAQRPELRRKNKSSAEWMSGGRRAGPRRATSEERADQQEPEHLADGFAEEPDFDRPEVGRPDSAPEHVADGFTEEPQDFAEGLETLRSVRQLGECLAQEALEERIRTAQREVEERRRPAPPVGPDHPSFRTKLCKFFDSGCCRYGEGCAYVHAAPSIRTCSFVDPPSRSHLQN